MPSLNKIIHKTYILSHLGKQNLAKPPQIEPVLLSTVVSTAETAGVHVVNESTTCNPHSTLPMRLICMFKLNACISHASAMHSIETHATKGPSLLMQPSFFFFHYLALFSFLIKTVLIKLHQSTNPRVPWLHFNTPSQLKTKFNETATITKQKFNYRMQITYTHVKNTIQLK